MLPSLSRFTNFSFTLRKIRNISIKKTKEQLISLLIDDIEIKATVLTKTKNGWTENNCSFLSAAEKNVIKFNINEESTDDDITIDYYNLRRIIRHCRDAHIPLTLSNKENDYIIIIENKYLRLLKYCIILQVIANEEKEKLALLITSNQNKRLTLIQNQAIDSL